MLRNEERGYWLGFSVFPGVGPENFKKLLAAFSSAKNAWEAERPRLVKVLGGKLGGKFVEFRNKFSIPDYLKRLKSSGVSFITLADKEYPSLLSKIKNPPFLLYVKGQAPDGAWFSQSIAVVGTRRTTQYGREVTKILTQDLVANGFTIVSGLAMGIDAVSHMATIENNGKTIAVLGCGVDCCFPKENQNLYNNIISGYGLVISEYPLGQIPTKGSFPSRNRIIAGLSLGVLVTEGAEDSGALITADYALRFGRRVFAVPGPITSSMSKGPYKLIAKGAKLVTSAEDILKEFQISNVKFPISNKTKIIKKGDTEEENKIIKMLRNEPLHFDELVRRTGFDSSKTGSLLSLMEVKGMVKSLEGGMFSSAS